VKDEDLKFRLYRWGMTLLSCVLVAITGLALYGVVNGMLWLLDVLLEMANRIVT
jgi:hypothetical protein